MTIKKLIEITSTIPWRELSEYTLYVGDKLAVELMDKDAFFRDINVIDNGWIYGIPTRLSDTGYTKLTRYKYFGRGSFTIETLYDEYEEKIVYISTPRCAGKSIFHEMFLDAVSGNTDYKHLTLDWVIVDDLQDDDLAEIRELWPSRYLYSGMTKIYKILERYLNED